MTNDAQSDRDRREHYTDVWNAENFARLHGDDLRYCAALGTWYLWDGRRWSRDETGEVIRRAVDTVRSFYADAAALEDPEQRTALAKHAGRSEALARITAMVELAKSHPKIAVAASDLDANGWVLNTLNGTVNLRSGELGPHHREDLITRLAPVQYDPAARLELLDTFLFQTTGADADLLRYLRRAVGYSLTADTSEERIHFGYGPTATGKSTLVEMIKATLGDYSATADFDTFLKRRDGGPRNDIARLAGRRFVVSVEVEKGQHLAEGLVKMITGGDTVTARFLYKEAFEFRPTAKLWLFANDRPRVSDEDDAVWRRIRLLPFMNIVPPDERDPTVKLRLRYPEYAGPAILAWAVRGCLEWQRCGLGSSSAIERATAEYRAEMDPVAPFLDECCVVESDAAVGSTDLYTAYVAWTHRAGEHHELSSNAFGRRLTARGLELEKGTHGARLRQGLRLVEQLRLERNGDRPDESYLKPEEVRW